MTLYYVYILASHKRVLYTGITSKIEKRTWEHKHDVDPESFTARYRVHKLVCFEEFIRPETAIAREKQIKSWRREKRVALINGANPKWRDLSTGWGERYRDGPLHMPDVKRAGPNTTGLAEPRSSPDPSRGKERPARDAPPHGSGAQGE